MMTFCFFYSFRGRQHIYCIRVRGADQSNIWGPPKIFWEKASLIATYTGTFCSDNYKPSFYHPSTVLCTTLASQSMIYVLMITVGFYNVTTLKFLVIHLGFDCAGF